MDNKRITFSADSVYINREHYTVSNGFLSKASRGVRLRYSDLLSVEIVKRRSKKAMYAVLIIGSILMAVLGAVRTSYTKQLRDAMDLSNAYDTAITIYETVRDGRDSKVYQSARNTMTVLMVITAAATVSGVIFLFSGKRFVELTTMSGTYRVVIEHGDGDIHNIVMQLRDITTQPQRNPVNLSGTQQTCAPSNTNLAAAFCSNCGKALAPNSAFCSGCGVKIG